MYTLEDFLSKTDLPERYAVMMDFEVARKAKSGQTLFEEIYTDLLTTVRSGGAEQTKAYYSKVQQRHNTTTYGLWHPYSAVDCAELQARIIFLSGNKGGIESGSDCYNTLVGYDADYGIGGDANINNRGRYIAVRQEDRSKSLRDAFGPDYAAQMVWGEDATAGLRLALDTAQLRGPNGYIASMPELMQARVAVGFDNLLWTVQENNVRTTPYISAYSEMNIIRKDDGSRFLVFVHGGGILAYPDRIFNAFRMDADMWNAGCSLTGDYTPRLNEQEASDLLEGKLPDGTRLPLFEFSEFAKGIQHLPRRYAVIMDYETAKSAAYSFDRPLKDMHSDPLLIVNCGGPQHVGAYLEKLTARGQETVGGWYPFQKAWNHDQFNSSYILYTNAYGSTLAMGLAGTTSRYVAVAPDKADTSLRHMFKNVPVCMGVGSVGEE
eukprot:gnl/TRDRNA2_/TRDRNA2_84129_c0_seq1.p1 gnl/TRDRNA2_/TRDRNA2_84129_c0~~gnl/TRDRNA2_/TRDRNA2_84129_c0_seq1.p1  ORF type:complete len:476 (-),score=87.24 gnl/TRDRNA2_/TRDRNA2_84129_c0_seq1:622-1929(-)